MSGPIVHNHGPAEGPGLGCPERRTEIGGYLRGACLPDPVEPEPYCDHGPFDACRCLVRPRLEPGDQIAGILKDHDGRVIGYTVQAEASGQLGALLSAGNVGGYSVRFERQGKQ
jgi:hypothetical protein